MKVAHKIVEMIKTGNIEGVVFCLWYTRQAAEKIGVKVKEKGMSVEDFLKGNGLFLPGATYMYSHFRGYSPENYANGIPIEQPYARQPNGLVGFFLNTFAVMKASPNRKAAIDLSMMWAEPIVAEKWVEYTKNPTGLRGNLNRPAFTTDNLDIYGRFLLDMEKQYTALLMRDFRAPTYVFGEDISVTDEAFRNNLVLIMEGKLKAGEYYKEILSQIQLP